MFMTDSSDVLKFKNPEALHNEPQKHPVFCGEGDIKVIIFYNLY